MVSMTLKSFTITKKLSSSSSFSSSSFQFMGRNGRKHFITMAKKTELPENSKTHQGFSFPLRVSTTLVTQSAIFLFGLGFIDAGYSGDWSRIGVISKEAEACLKIGAFLVVPLCLFLILGLSDKSKNKN